MRQRNDWHGFPVHTDERMKPDAVHIVPPPCGAQDPYTSGRCNLSMGHDGQHYAVVGAGARQWGRTRERGS